MHRSGEVMQELRKMGYIGTIEAIQLLEGAGCKPKHGTCERIKLDALNIRHVMVPLNGGLNRHQHLWKRVDIERVTSQQVLPKLPPVGGENNGDKIRQEMIQLRAELAAMRELLDGLKGIGGDK